MRFFDPATVRSVGLVQDLTVETDNLEFFKLLLRAAVEVCGCREVAYTETEGRVGSAGAGGSGARDYPSEVYARGIGRCGGRLSTDRPLHWRVCRLIGERVNPGYESRGPEQDEKGIPCADAGAAVAQVVELLKRVDLDAFSAACGEIGPFDCDSSTRVGYRLHLSYMSRGLTVALCHVYYPK